MLKQFIKKFTDKSSFSTAQKEIFVQNTFWEYWTDAVKYTAQTDSSTAVLTLVEADKSIRFYPNLNDMVQRNTLVVYDFNLGEYRPDSVKLYNSNAPYASHISKVLLDGYDMGTVSECAIADSENHNVCIIVDDILTFDTTNLLSTINIASKITNVYLGKGIDNIGESAFEGLSSIKEITMPNSVTKVESKAFANCPSLQKVVVSKHAKTIAQDCYLNSPLVKEFALEKNGIIVEKTNLKDEIQIIN